MLLVGRLGATRRGLRTTILLLILRANFKPKKKVNSRIIPFYPGVSFWFPYFPAGRMWHDAVTAGSCGVAVQFAQHPKPQRFGGIRDLGAQLGFAPAIL